MSLTENVENYLWNNMQSLSSVGAQPVTIATAQYTTSKLLVFRCVVPKDPWLRMRTYVFMACDCVCAFMHGHVTRGHDLRMFVRLRRLLPLVRVGFSFLPHVVGCRLTEMKPPHCNLGHLLRGQSHAERHKPHFHYND